MEIYLGQFPIALLLVALLIPLIYSILWKRKGFKNVFMIFIFSSIVVGLYPMVNYLSSIMPYFGYSIGKVIIFMLIPIIAVSFLERWSLKKIFTELGVRKKGIGKSLIYSIIAAVITIIITVLVSTITSVDWAFRTIMFFEAFTEEFFFRGFLFLYLLKKTNTKVAYLTSITGFILIHSQNFTRLFLISTIAQGILLSIVTHKTKNIIGPWVSHGLNRFVPVLIKMLL